MVKRAATLEYALSEAGMPPKEGGRGTSLGGVICQEYSNMTLKTYTTLLASNEEPLFNKITQMVLKPPAGYELGDPTKDGTPQRWYRPWRKLKVASPPQASYSDDTEPIIKLASSTLGPGHRDEGDDELNLGANTLLGYK